MANIKVEYWVNVQMKVCGFKGEISDEEAAGKIMSDAQHIAGQVSEKITSAFKDWKGLTIEAQKDIRWG